MSTLNITDLLRELQAGEEARAKIPQLQEAVNANADRADKLAVHNQGLETSIIDYKRTIDGLNAKVRSLEVERDDAGFRELEASDKVNTLLNALHGLRIDASNAIAIVDPPKPEPVAPEVVQNAGMPVNKPDALQTMMDHAGSTQGERVADPTESANSMTTGQTNVTMQSVEALAAVPFGTSVGQSDPRPTASLTEATLPFASGDAASPSALAPSTNDPQAYRPFGGDAVGADKPNAGKPYWERPDGMSWADWQASGGSV